MDFSGALAAERALPNADLLQSKRQSVLDLPYVSIR